MGKKLDPDNHKSNFSYFSISYKQANLTFVCANLDCLIYANMAAFTETYCKRNFFDRFFKLDYY